MQRPREMACHRHSLEFKNALYSGGGGGLDWATALFEESSATVMGTAYAPTASFFSVDRFSGSSISASTFFLDSSVFILSPFPIPLLNHLIDYAAVVNTDF